jgi:hypothetical protein
MIAVDAIDVVAQEQKRQMSGAVSDNDIALLGRDAGAQYVCVVQRSELDGFSYVATRMVSVQSKVAEAADIVELPQGGKIIDIIQWQIGSMLGMAVGPRPTVSAGSGYAASARPVSQYPVQTASAPERAEPPIQGAIVPGGSLAQKLVWLQKSADSHNTYIVEVNADETIEPHTFEFRGGINITIVLRGVGGNRTIRLQKHGRMFNVGREVTFVLDNNITLRGHNGNEHHIVNVEGGTFKMNNGATITGNPKGGVYMSSGTFEMNGGAIVGNGRITNHLHGAGIDIYDGTVTMTGGTISGNTASHGGGVKVYCGTFIMRGGIISGNTATVYGGGVLVEGCRSASFVKSGGTITGYSSDPANGNVVKDEEGAILARRGHAVYKNENTRKETTAGPSDNFAKDGSGVWDQ